MRKFYIIFLLLAIAMSVNAQKVLLEEDVNYFEDIPENGPNRKHYYHFYGSWGMMFGSTENNRSPIKEALSYRFDLGFRYKRKISEFYSLGYELNLGNNNFRLADENARTLPDIKHYDKEKINLYNFGIGLYNRFNFGRRGNYIGNFMDIGAYGNWNYFSRYYYKDEVSNGEKRKFSQNNPDYMKPIQYGIFARIGYNRYVIFGRYRLSDMINSDTQYMDLPAYTAGIQIGFHK
ncbi:MAG: outer membrane beta-barrel protein [Bacteroidales bacterium]|nr:outer membrane beta-barrel protein [Bacteroidales bacterium]